MIDHKLVEITALLNEQLSGLVKWRIEEDYILEIRGKSKNNLIQITLKPNLKSDFIDVNNIPLYKEIAIKLPNKDKAIVNNGTYKATEIVAVLKEDFKQLDSWIQELQRSF